jgi:hypothetical protein
VWDVRQLEAHGVSRYPFGRDGWLDLSCKARRSAAALPQITVKSSVALTLELRWNHPDVDDADSDSSPLVQRINVQPTQ